MKRIRRTLLFIPGDNPGMIQNAGIFGADSVVFDLEDAVSISEKDSARILVRNALKEVNFYNTETIVRINSIDSIYGREDIQSIIKSNPMGFMIPKASVENIIEVSKLIGNQDINIFPIIESAYGLVNISNIINSSDKICAILFGAEDFTADMGIERTKEGNEIFYARNRIATACKAFGIDAIDTPYIDISDEEGLFMDTGVGKSFGMTGKAAINPRQIDIINEVFMPSNEEIEEALKIIEISDKAIKKGKGVLTIDGKMIDAPIIARAENILKIAKLANLEVIF